MNLMSTLSMRLGSVVCRHVYEPSEHSEAGQGYMIFQQASTILRSELLDSLKRANTLRHESLSHVFLSAWVSLRSPWLAPEREVRQYFSPLTAAVKFSEKKRGLMERRTTSWFSPNLQMEMPLVAYGHAGQTLLMLPTAAADYLEYERFYLVDAIKSFIEQGLIRAYSINSVNRYSLLNEEMPPKLKAELLTRYDRYITDEVLPLIRNENGEDTGRLPRAPVWARFCRRTNTSSIPICFAG